MKFKKVSKLLDEVNGFISWIHERDNPDTHEDSMPDFLHIEIFEEEWLIMESNSKGVRMDNGATVKGLYNGLREILDEILTTLTYEEVLTVRERIYEENLRLKTARKMCKRNIKFE